MSRKIMESLFSLNQNPLAIVNQCLMKIKHHVQKLWLIFKKKKEGRSLSY